jgi:addiction module HigA family antidote
MTIFNPPHPGSILKEDLMTEIGIGVTEAAKQLGVSRVAFSRVINGRAAISVDMALRLEVWMSTPSAESWIRMQTEYDLWQARQKPRPAIKPISRFYET